MGQRLVITIKRKNKDLAKIYYHWSAYTDSALYEVDRLLDQLEMNGNITNKQLQLQLIRACEKNGGGIDGGSGSEEFQYIQKVFPGETFEGEEINRNEGLIAISENGMDRMQQWSEGDVIIDFDDGYIYNNVCTQYESLDIYNEYRIEYEMDEVSEKDVLKIPFDLSLIKFGKLKEAIEVLSDRNYFLYLYDDILFEAFA